jgi:hypothetical protein
MATPDFEWLQMRITEEQERRERENMILERLPLAAAELEQSLAACVASYNAAFGAGAAEMESNPPRIAVVVREQTAGAVGREQTRVEVVTVPAIPGFQIDRAGTTLLIEVGLLAGEKMFYRDREQDQYLGMEDLTRRILDRVLFPKLGE